MNVVFMWCFYGCIDVSVIPDVTVIPLTMRGRQNDRQNEDKHTDRQTDIQTDRQTDRQTDSKINK